MLSLWLLHSKLLPDCLPVYSQSVCVHFSFSHLFAAVLFTSDLEGLFVDCALCSQFLTLQGDVVAGGEEAALFRGHRDQRLQDNQHFLSLSSISLPWSALFSLFQSFSFQLLSQQLLLQRRPQDQQTNNTFTVCCCCSPR